MNSMSEDDERVPVACGACEGRGTITVRIVSPEPGSPETITCPACHGTGTRP